jgi:PAS domain-containing protein
VNEQALLSGQLGSLSVDEALKEEGIKEAFIIQQSDGAIVAPSEKVGRDTSRPFILTARKEARAAVGRIDSDTLGASYPIGVYDPISGEPAVKYHAIVLYDIGSLNIDEGRVISLFLQTLIIASALGFILYFLFARLVEFPIRSLNQQIDQALREKTDRAEVLFDDPSIQKLVTNVNTLLSRALSAANTPETMKPQQNRDAEFNNLVEMVTQPAFVIAVDHRIVNLNDSFEQLTQTSRDSILNQSYQLLTDSSLVQNIDSLIVRALQSPFERHTDRIPFSQFECDIQCVAFLDANGQPEYYLMTLNKAENS